LRSFPFAWHFRVFAPLFRIRWHALLLHLRTLLKSRADRQRETEGFLVGLCPVGKNPMEFVTVYRSWASLDDCDFNGHLSNSSYAKALDMSRFKLATASFPLFFSAKGWMALAGTNFTFIREIPMFAKYEVRLSVVAWDNKWIYVGSRFVTHSKQKPKNQQSKNDDTPHERLFSTSLRTPASGLATPLPTSTNTTPATNTNADATMKALAGLGLRQTEPDGATLHCISISQCCFKHGRITVPPAIVLASHGLSVSAPPSGPVYSLANPPPHWGHAQAVLGKTGSPEVYGAFLSGGWRDVAEGERWWEEALGGAVEERRRANLEALDGVRKGMEAAVGF